MKKNVMKKKLDHLKELLEVIQTDTTQITSRDDKIDLIIRTRVFKGSLGGLSMLFSEEKLNRYNQIVDDVFKYIVPILDNLSYFLQWQDKNKNKQFELKYPVSHTLIKRDDGTFSQFEVSTLIPRHSHFSFDEHHYRPLIVTVFEHHHEDFYHPSFVEKIELCEDFISLAKALNEVSSDSIKTCEHCSKFFVQATKREKRYCTTRCQNTAAVKRLRSKGK